MAKPTCADLELLLREAIIPFYFLERDIYTPPPVRRLENDAEHSWSLALFACALAPTVDADLDIGLVSQFAVVHDLAELYAGDTSVWAAPEELATKETREAAALQKIDKRFKAFPWLCDTLHAYECQDSPEARFVRSADKCLALLLDYVDECRYHRAKRMTLQDFVDGMQEHRRKAKIHQGMFQYYEDIWNMLVARTEFFCKPGERRAADKPQ